MLILDALTFLSILNWYYSQKAKNKIVLDISVSVFSIIVFICLFELFNN
ncbi:hypothetical protein CCP1ISM_90028 [Azospirillaceae bacterium]